MIGYSDADRTPLIPTSLLIFSTIKLFFSSNFEKLLSKQYKRYSWDPSFLLALEKLDKLPSLLRKNQLVCITTTGSFDNEKQKSESVGPGCFYRVKSPSFSS
jgi:hypothetical protein